MIQIQRILCPVDFSATSQLALRYAIGLAKDYEAKIHLLHVVEPAIPAGHEYPIDTSDLMRSLEETAAGQLDQASAMVRKSGVPVTSEVLVGDPSLEIQNQVAKKKIDLVVMGTHGRRGFQRFLVGSVTERLLRTLPVPVMTLSSSKAKPSPVKIQRIMIATDLGEGTTDAVSFGLSIAQECQAKVTLLHVLHDLVAADVANKYKDALMRGISDELNELIPDEATTWCDIRTRVEVGTPHRVILKVVEDDKPDLLVLNIHGKAMLDRAVLGSTAERVIRGAACAVLAVPPKTRTKASRK